MATENASLPLKRLVAFQLAAIVFGLGLLGATELLMRQYGVMAPPPPVQPAQWERGFISVTSMGLLQYLEKTDDGMIQTSRRGVQNNFLLDIQFTPQPAPNTYRIFCFGGSATMGVPNERYPETSFPGRLQSHLSEAGMTVEVINLGGASLGSRQVLEAATEAAQYGPSAFVIYSGNNEFFQYNLRLHDANQHHLVLKSRLESIRIYQGLRHLYRSLRGEKIDPQGDLVSVDPTLLRANQQRITAALIQRTLISEVDTGWPKVSEGLVESRIDSHFKRVVQEYKGNLEAIGELSKTGDKPLDIFIAEIPANLLRSPQLSLHHPNLGPIDKQRFSFSWNAALAAQEAKDIISAIEHLSDAIERDPVYAEAHYLRGFLRLQQHKITQDDDLDSIAIDLKNGLQLDMDPGRPPEALRQIIRDLSDNPNLENIAVGAPFSAHGVRPFGEGLFADACHMTPEGYNQLAWEIATAISIQRATNSQ